MDIKKIKDIVEVCLKENEPARDSDWKLYECVCHKLGFDSYSTTLHQVVECSKLFPTFESVSRARRKIQATGMY